MTLLHELFFFKCESQVFIAETVFPLLRELHAIDRSLEVCFGFFFGFSCTRGIALYRPQIDGKRAEEDADIDENLEQLLALVEKFLKNLLLAVRSFPE